MRGLIILSVWTAVVLGGSLASAAPAPARSFQAALESLWQRAGVETLIPAGTGLPEALFRLAADEAARERVLAVADTTSRVVTDSLLAFVTLPEPEAHRQLPELYVIRDFGLPPEERPPAWARVREVGVELLSRIAFDLSKARDLRALREWEALRPEGRSARPSEVGAQVDVFRRWWIDRGDDPRLTHDPRRIPDPGEWLAKVAEVPVDTTWSGLRLLARLDGSGLRLRLFLEALNEGDHAYLAAECVQVQRIDGVSFAQSGIEGRHWSPELGKNLGHRIEDLRGIARQILDRVTGHIASGADERALRNDWVSWWQRARFQARYWRDPRASPTLDPWMEGLDRSVAEGGVAIASWVRKLYVTLGSRDFLVEQLGPEHAPIVAELMELLEMDREEALAAGFNFSYRRRLLLPRRDFRGDWVVIPWPQVQAFIRQILGQITGISPPTSVELSDFAAMRFWSDWWAAERFEARWYRSVDQVPRGESLFEMPRARAG